MTRPPLVVHITSPKPVARPDTAHPTEKPNYVMPRGKANPLAVAKQWLGKRLVLRETGHHSLDGQPAGLDQIMKATNRVLVAQGVEQVLHSDRWRV